jgi:hypothetical protein
MSEVNTQVAEQSNSLLNRLKSTVSYMTQKNYIQTVKLFIGYRNIIYRGKLGACNADEENQIIKHRDCFSHGFRR